MKTLIHGIPCEISDRQLQATIETVLSRAKARQPKDHTRIVERLKTILWLPQEKAKDGTTGGVEKIGQPRTLKEKTLWQDIAPRRLFLARGLCEWETAGQRAVVAHELGHVATRRIDIERRQALSDEWGSELAADWYAYRWGFGRDLRRLQHWESDFLHHFVGPGGECIVEELGRFRVTRNFVVRLVEEWSPALASELAPVETEHLI